MDNDGDDGITLEQFMERAGLNSTARKYRGVQQQKSGKWGAVVSFEGSKVWLGTFDTAEEAAVTYDMESLRIRGSKARLNFPKLGKRSAPASQPTQVARLSSNSANDSPLTSYLQYQHLFHSEDFTKDPWGSIWLPDQGHSNFEPQSVVGVELHLLNNLEGESEKLEDSTRQLIHVDATYSASRVNPEEGDVAPNPVADIINDVKGPVEGDRINISFHDLEKHFGKPLNVAAENIGVSRSTMKRACRKNGIFRWPSHKRNKYNHFYRTQQGGDGSIRTPTRSLYWNSSTIQDEGSTLPHQIPEPEATVEDCRIVIIKASYEDTMMKFQLSIASELSELEEEVAKRLNLKVGGFKMVYQDEDNDSITILCDTDLHFCFKSLTSPGKDTVRMMVRPRFNKE